MTGHVIFCYIFASHTLLMFFMRHIIWSKFHFFQTPWERCFVSHLIFKYILYLCFRIFMHGHARKRMCVHAHMHRHKHTHIHTVFCALRGVGSRLSTKSHVRNQSCKGALFLGHLRVHSGHCCSSIHTYINRPHKSSGSTQRGEISQ